jgi:hypothetical protein
LQGVIEHVGVAGTDDPPAACPASEQVAARTTHGMRTAEMERLRGLVRDLKAGAKRLVELA